MTGAERVVDQILLDIRFLMALSPKLVVAQSVAPGDIPTFGVGKCLASKPTGLFGLGRAS